MSDDNPEKSGPADENHLIAERRAKLAKLRERGNAFPNDFRRDALAADIATAYGEKSTEALDAAAVSVRVAGRMRAKRVMGKASFAKLEDSKSDVSWGNQIRSYVLDQSRIKDLRTGVEIGNTTAVLDGALDEFMQASLKQGL